MGPLRRGVGRLVAGPAIPPLVVPFYHTGMKLVLDRSKSDRLPICLGQRMSIEVGDAMDFSELIAVHRRRGGSEEELHVEITRRIEVAMQGLQARAAERRREERAVEVVDE